MVAHPDRREGLEFEGQVRVPPPTPREGGSGLPLPGQVGGFAIEAVGISKAFYGSPALTEVDFAVAPGEIHGLVGKNGAGKSTFMKILSGAQAPDKGEIIVGGQAFRALSPADGQAAGIAIVYQNPEMHLDLSVAANIFLGGEPRRLGLIDNKAMERGATALLERLGIALPVKSRLGDLDIARRQQVAIARAVRRKPHVLLLDEPTAALNKGQVDFLFRLIRDLARQNIAIVYVSHHLDEVLAISDRVTVLRNGRKVAVVQGGSADKDALIGMIVGRNLEAVEAHRAVAAVRPTCLTLRNISVPTQLDDVSLTLGRGEIIGLTGLVGGGANALAAVISGVERRFDGVMTLDGQTYRPGHVRDAIARGVLFIPEDMRGRGLVMPLSIANNVSLGALRRLSRAGCINLSRENAAAMAMAERLDLNPRVPKREVRFLSGGNQRKALLGRAILANGRLFVLEEPTQGVDVESQRQIHDHLRGLANDGASIVFVSTDLEELIALADRILVLRDGRIDAELEPSDLTPDQLLFAIQTPRTRRPG